MGRRDGRLSFRYCKQRKYICNKYICNKYKFFSNLEFKKKTAHNTRINIKKNVILKKHIARSCVKILYIYIYKYRVLHAYKNVRKSV